MPRIHRIFKLSLIWAFRQNPIPSTTLYAGSKPGHWEPILGRGSSLTPHIYSIVTLNLIWSPWISVGSVPANCLDVPAIFWGVPANLVGVSADYFWGAREARLGCAPRCAR